ncbi:S66 peptidase family protein [Pustulibacterium marinum]|nr:LD-carboxypeptidase [Pustulibacterium marinum]
MKKLLATSLCYLLFSVTILSAQSMKQPPFLKKGDTVAIVAPAGIIKSNRSYVFQAAENYLKSLGLHVSVGKNVLKQGGHFAGSDEERCADFQTALDDPSIKAIWCARGGYGSVRILDMLDYTKFKKHPKWIIGYSDITAFHNQMNVLGYQSLHAMMCTSLESDATQIKETKSTFEKAIFGQELTYSIPSNSHNYHGNATGQLVGGNLSLLVSMLGSKTALDTSGKIVFIEEIGEYKYSIDRMMQSLKRAGFFDNCKGIVFGDITRIKNNPTKFGKIIYELLLDVVTEYNVPILFDFPAGHEPDNRALFLGRNVELKVNDQKSTLKFL